LMDVNMPVMNGIDATKLYRFSALGRPHIPIIALTADATEQVKQRCAEAGMDDCLTKPIEPRRLIEIIEKIGGKGLKTGQQQAASAQDKPSPLRVLASPAIDFDTLKALEKLGGREFVDELFEQFLDDATIALRELAMIAKSGDAVAFREQMHALRSAAANVGARGIYDLCLGWRQIAAAELVSRGESYLDALRREFERARAALQDRFVGRNAA
jgi:two-component system, sensor histidine kinase RpfC